MKYMSCGSPVKQLYQGSYIDRYYFLSAILGLCFYPILSLFRI